MLPTAGAWTLIVSKEPSGFHTNYIASADLGRLELTKRSLDTPVEQLTFAIAGDAAGRGGVIKMSWETTEVSVPFTVQCRPRRTQPLLGVRPRRKDFSRPGSSVVEQRTFNARAAGSIPA